jgi:hypothetical protein
MLQAKQQGRHSYAETWALNPHTDSHHFVESFQEWCKDTIALCRRPFGINHFDLVLTVNDSRRQLGSLSLEKVRPLLLYAGDFPDQVSKTLSDALHALADEPELRVSATIFSWGDAADAALPRRK